MSTIVMLFENLNTLLQFIININSIKTKLLMDLKKQFPCAHTAQYLY